MFMKLSFEDQWSAGLICISLRNLPAAKFWGPPPLFYGLYTTKKPCPTPTGWWFGTWILFFHILEIIIPTDKLIFFRGVGIPPTSPDPQRFVTDVLDVLGRIGTKRAWKPSVPDTAGSSNGWRRSVELTAYESVPFRGLLRRKIAENVMKM